MASPVRVWLFSVPSVSSRRFLCHLCTTHFPCIFFLTKCPSGIKVFINHIAIKEIYMESNTTFSKGLEDPLLIDFEQIVFIFWFKWIWLEHCHPNSPALRVREGLSFIHMSRDGHLRTRNGELSGFLLIHSTVFKCFCYV